MVAPTVFRILFASAPLEVEELHRLIDIALGQ
ncbi:TetR family transcriptional regulator, partial [Pseudomonas corrugata]|nr:TetR family transcriptional regulator [Pseudomonas corrugata]